MSMKRDRGRWPPVTRVIRPLLPLLAMLIVLGGSDQADRFAAHRLTMPPPASTAIDDDATAPNPEDDRVIRTNRPAVPTIDRLVTSTGGTWTEVTAFQSGLDNPLLLTDGTVIAQTGGSASWARLTPDIDGRYETGTWTQLASLPVIGGVQYAPLYHASNVLPDGRLLIMGGEYNGNNPISYGSLGAIYDPLTGLWTPVAAPAGWAHVGDAPSTILPDGTLMLGNCCATPSLEALFDARTLTWTTTGAPSIGVSQHEQGYELLPDDSVLTIDTYPPPDIGEVPPTATERYLPTLGVWIAAGATPVSLIAAGPVGCDQEIGPAVLRPDGTVVAFGGYTGCAANPTPDPTAIYNASSRVWSAGPSLPAQCGPDGNAICSMADAPAALLPDGNILFAASGLTNLDGAPPTGFFEFHADNTIARVSAPLFNANDTTAFEYNFLVLPTGQILMTDVSGRAELYTPAGTPDPGWAPAITAAPSTIAPGSIYAIGGTQFNGLSQGAYYGDDIQAATNYPIVRITNAATGHVFYARTFDHSTMSIAPNTAGGTNFLVPSAIEAGPSRLEIVANGIASAPVAVTIVGPSVLAAAVLPGSRSVRIGETATFAASVINTGAAALDNCGIALAPSAPAGLTLSYQATNPTTNALTGSPDTPVSIAGGNGVQSFVIALTGTAAVGQPNLALAFTCDGVPSAPFQAGLDTIDLNYAAAPTPDVIALVAAPGGILTVPVTAAAGGAFAVATFDAGAAGAVTVTADTGPAGLPLTLTLCPTDPATSVCLSAPAAAVQASYQPNATQTFAIFASAGAPIALAPATSRVFVRFTDGTGIVRGLTSVAVRTE